MIKNKIKEMRQKKNLSQEQLAEKAQVSVRTIQRLEAGEDASISTLNLVAGALNVGVGDLFEREKTEEQKEKIRSAQQLKYQLDRRHEEYANYKKVYNIAFIIVMMLLGTFFPMMVSASFLGTLLFIVAYTAGWMIMSPLKKWIGFYKIDAKLDKKYPLTANQVGKDQ